MDKSLAAVGGISRQEHLRDRDILCSLIFLVRPSFSYITVPFNKTNKIGIPYIRAKAKDYFEQLGGGLNADFPGDGSNTGQIQGPSDHVRSAILNFPSALMPYRASKAASVVFSRLYTRIRPWLSRCGYYHGMSHISSNKRLIIDHGLAGLVLTFEGFPSKISYVLEPFSIKSDRLTR